MTTFLLLSHCCFLRHHFTTHNKKFNTLQEYTNSALIALTFSVCVWLQNSEKKNLTNKKNLELQIRENFK